MISPTGLLLLGTEPQQPESLGELPVRGYDSSTRERITPLRAEGLASRTLNQLQSYLRPARIAANLLSLTAQTSPSYQSQSL